jgi:hypothetical protein
MWFVEKAFQLFYVAWVVDWLCQSVVVGYCGANGALMFSVLLCYVMGNGIQRGLHPLPYQVIIVLNLRYEHKKHE